MTVSEKNILFNGLRRPLIFDLAFILMKLIFFLVPALLLSILSAQDPNCAFQGPTGQCFVCRPNYFLSNGVCRQTNSNCLNTNQQNGQCLSCLSGYNLTSDGQCVSVSSVSSGNTMTTTTTTFGPFLGGSSFGSFNTGSAGGSIGQNFSSGGTTTGTSSGFSGFGGSSQGGGSSSGGSSSGGSSTVTVTTVNTSDAAALAAAAAMAAANSPVTVTRTRITERTILYV